VRQASTQEAERDQGKRQGNGSATPLDGRRGMTELAFLPPFCCSFVGHGRDFEGETGGSRGGIPRNSDQNLKQSEAFRAGRLAGRAKCSTLLKVLVGIPGNSAPGTTSFSFEVTPVTNERTTKRREKGQLRHATPPIWRGCTAVSLPFPLVPFRFLCGRLPHSASAQIA